VVSKAVLRNSGGGVRVSFRPRTEPGSVAAEGSLSLQDGAAADRLRSKRKGDFIRLAGGAKSGERSLIG